MITKGLEILIIEADVVTKTFSVHSKIVHMFGQVNIGNSMNYWFDNDSV